MLKSLPKNVRQKLPPPVQIAKTFSERQSIEDHALKPALSTFLFNEYQLTVPVDSWTTDKLPPHLNIRYSVIDDQGSEIKNSRDIEALQKELTEQVRQTSLNAYRRQWEKDNITRWDFGRLPENIELTGKHGLTGYAYLALQVVDGVIHLRLFADPREAAAGHVQGVAALYDIFFADKLKQLKKTSRWPAI